MNITTLIAHILVFPSFLHICFFILVADESADFIKDPTLSFIFTNSLCGIISVCILMVSCVCIGYYIGDSKYERKKYKVLREIDDRVGKLAEFARLARLLVVKDADVLVNEFVDKLKTEVNEGK